VALPTAAARYLQVKHFVLERISAGALRAGQRVPSENELVRELDVSRMTANRALRELAADGVLVRVAGVGTFRRGAGARMRIPSRCAISPTRFEPGDTSISPRWRRLAPSARRASWRNAAA